MTYFKHMTRIIGDSEFIIFYEDSDTIAKIYCPDNDLIIYYYDDGSIWVNDSVYQNDLEDRKKYDGDYPDFEELRKQLGI